MKTITKIQLDMYRVHPVVVSAKPSDTGRYVQADLGSFAIPETADVYLVSGTVKDKSHMTRIDDTHVEFLLTKELLTAGKHVCELQIVDGAEQMTTFSFLLDVEPSAANDTAIEETAAKSVIQEMQEFMAAGGANQEKIDAAVKTYLDGNQNELLKIDPTLTKADYSAEARATGFGIQNAKDTLNSRIDTELANLATVAKTGSYNDLADKPEAHKLIINNQTYDGTQDVIVDVSGGSGSGTNNYEDLTNLPSINDVQLVGDLKTGDLVSTETIDEMMQSWVDRTDLKVAPEQTTFFDIDKSSNLYSGSHTTADAVATSDPIKVSPGSYVYAQVENAVKCVRMTFYGSDGAEISTEASPTEPVQVPDSAATVKVSWNETDEALAFVGTAETNAAEFIPYEAYYTQVETIPKKYLPPVAETDRVYLCIGDSYADGYNPDGNNSGWPVYFADYMGLDADHFFSNHAGGAGFVNVGSSNNGSKNFLMLLNESDDADNFHAGQLLTVDPSLVTDIIVVGGANDANADRYDAINTAMQEFMTAAAKKFPNATVHVGMAGRGGSRTAAAMYSTMQAYKNAGWYDNADYLTGIETALQNPDLRGSDDVHPTEQGNRVIARNIVNCLTGGGATGGYHGGMVVSTEKVSYVTAEWAAGTGGFKWVVPATGIWIVIAMFNTGGAMTYYQDLINVDGKSAAVFHISAEANIKRHQERVPVISRLKKGQVVTPYVHTGTKGVTYDTQLTAYLINMEEY